MTLTVASLCSGYEATGLGLALAGWDHRLAFVADPDPAAAKVLAHQHPDVPNLGDITRVAWEELGLAGEIDLLTAGFPCTDISCAGRRAGLGAGTRSGVWANVTDAIDVLRPRLVLIENVAALLSTPANRSTDATDGGVEPGPAGLGDGPGRPLLRAAGAVLGDLADLGFDAVWQVVSAAEVGAPHLRKRVFILAWSAADPPRFGHGHAGPAGGGGLPAAAVGGAVRPDGLSLLPTPRTSDTQGADERGTGGLDLRTAVSLLPTPRARDVKGAETEATRASRVERGTAHAGHDLPTALSLLPTPTARDGDGRGEGSPDYWQRRREELGRDNGIPLGAAINLLPTPRATDGTKGGPNQRGSSGDLMLPSAVVQLLPTPTAAATPKSKRALSASTDNGRRSGGGQSSPPGLDEVALLVSGVRPDNLPPDEELPPKTRALVESLLPTPTVADARGSRNATAGRGVDASSEWSPGWSLSDVAYADRWGEYAPAIARWERVVGRPAPDPTEPGTKGQPRLAARFVEWLQGLPDGHVTAVPGIGRNDALRLLGNANPPQQYAAAITRLAAIVAAVTAPERAA